MNYIISRICGINTSVDTSETVRHLINNKKDLDSSVYTPWRRAIEEIDKRRADSTLKSYVNKSLARGIPDIMRDKKSIILFRHVATPNYEINRFMACADTFSDFQALILEYTEDQFNDRNQGKYFLGKLRFQKGLNKNNQPISENVNIINFNESNNKPISTVPTKWGQSLVDFHHEMFNERFKDFSKCVCDLSSWLHSYGMTGKNYYKPFLTLFLRDAILFENFFVNDKELNFTESVILPAFCEIEKECGFKPLIVTLAPTEIEADDFWYSYPYYLKKFIDKKISG